ncbi:hypothetical protein RND81_08G196800 [Saponaria officinalis]|uniref:Glutamyl-tRNA(Gln) amidotransferase subunit C, chloroplastic/mitochondrial n=1 Tax=Saponaria officinalis TaxID=3572 RepID=A0AAW1JA10_SAPOF
MEKMAAYSSKLLIAFKPTTNMLLNNSLIISKTTNFTKLFSQRTNLRKFSIKSSTFDPPDVARLANTARITLTPQEVEEFGPKIQKVVDWFGQLQAVDLESIEPALRSDIDGDNLRGDVPLNFENREAIIAAIPSYDEPYIKVPKVLNKE